MMTKKILGLAATVLLAVATIWGAGEEKSSDASNAILRLLNSRASGSPRGYAEAAKEVAAQAKEGKAVYAFVMALMSMDAECPKESRLDEATCKEYLEKYREPIKRIANEHNNPMALYLLSMENNDTNLLHRAAEAGNIQAENAWGALIFAQAFASGTSSNEVEQVLSKAHGYFKSAAGKGDANGLYNLGMCLWRGLGTAKDETAAFNCFRNAAEKGHPEAINNIGAFFREGIVVEKDLNLSTKWFAKSASFENPFGQLNYALALRRGEGVEKNLKAAVPLLEKAADGGCVEALDVLGVALWKGEGVETNAPRAFSLFMKAAMAGYPPAMENVSTCYEKGTGVAASEQLSLEWKIRSRAARGDRNAQAWLQKNADRK